MRLEYGEYYSQNVIKLNGRARCKRRSESANSKNSRKLNKAELITTCLMQLIF